MRSLALIAVTLGVLHAQDQDYKLTTHANLVILDVSVKDGSGRMIPDLEKEHFRIYENGKLQTISSFGRRDEPVTVGLVIDNSGSMRGKRDAVNRAATGFIDGSNRQDEVFVTHFNDSVKQSLPPDTPFTGDRNVLMRALNRGPSQGRTALYDAMISSLRQLESGKQARKSLLVLSDGGDNASRVKLAEVIDAVHASLATIYTIGIFDTDDPDRNPRVLQRLADISGGEAFFPKELDQVQDICGAIAKDIRNRYTIAYIPAESGGNRLRRIRVEAGSKSAGKLHVHARTSYTFPDSAGVGQ